MKEMTDKRAELEKVLTDQGLHLRGAFIPQEQDNVPGWSAKEKKTLILVGNVGPSLEGIFRSEALHHRGEHPLDHWTREVLDPLAKRWRGVALYPFGEPPFHPFEEWALRTGKVFRSPLGLLIDSNYGLWHAYRGALLLPGDWDLKGNTTHSPCVGCEDKPCLQACPVQAFRIDHYEVKSCLGYLETKDEACTLFGCASRRACPIGARFHYGPFQARFHMEAFKKHAVEISGCSN